MIKKISAMILALTMSLCAFTGCSKKDESSSSSDNSTGLVTFDPNNSQTDSSADTVAEPSLTIDGKKIDTDNFIMCTVDGVDIDFETFRYYYYSTYSILNQAYGVDMNTINNTDKGYETFMSNVISSIKQDVMIKKLAKENNCELTDEEMKTSVTDNITTAKSQYDSEEDFKKSLASKYHTEKTYENYLLTQALYKKVNEKVFSNEGKYATKYDDFRKVIKDSSKYACEVHVMIPFCAMVDLDDSTSSNYDSMSLSEKLSAKYSAYSALDEAGQKKAKEKAKKTAEEVLKKAKSGADFDKLVKEYGWDVTLEQSPKGLYLNKENAVNQGFPKELVDGAFAVKEGKINPKIAENETYGYFIIKRVPVDMEYVNENISSLTYDYDAPKISATMEDLMNKMKVTYCDGWDKITSESIT